MRSLSLAAGLLTVALATSCSVAHPEQQAFSLPPSQNSVDRITFASTSQTATFTGQKVVRFSTKSQHQHKELIEQAHTLGLDVWAAQLGAACGTEADGFGCVDIRLASDTHDEDPRRAMTPDLPADQIVADLLRPFVGHKEQPRMTTLIEDLDQLVSEQQQDRLSTAVQASTEALRRSSAWHREYHTLDEITQYMKALEQGYPSHARVVEIGITHEGRPILALEISNGLEVPEPPQQPPPTEPQPQPDPPSNVSSTKAQKLGIVITGGQHAREWISTSASLFFASDLLRAALGAPVTPPNSTYTPLDDESDYEDDFGTLKRKGKKNRKPRKIPPTWTKSSARAILSTFTLTVIPVSNPDGYVYSWDHNRMWRKNRQPNSFPGGVFCKGVDLNRNYGFQFNAGGSACSEMYPGNEAFSAAETRAIAEIIGDEERNVRGYFDLHSYGQLMMYPYSWSCDEAVADEEDLLELSLGAASALKRVHGRQFNVGKVCQVYATGGGNSVDWSYASDTGVQGGWKEKVKWSFSVELRDGGTYGFLLPKEQIVPASEEVSAALAYMLEFIKKKNGR